MPKTNHQRNNTPPRILVSWLKGTNGQMATAVFSGWDARLQADGFKSELAWQRGVHSIRSTPLAEHSERICRMR